MNTSFNIVIGGEAGQGLATIGQTLGKALTQAGYRLHVTQTYESRIRGGHNTFALRVGTEVHTAPSETIDLLIALDAASAPMHATEFTSGGMALCDEKHVADAPKTIKTAGLPSSLAAGRHQNTAFLGAAGALLGLDRTFLGAALAKVLGKQPAEVIQQNETAMNEAYDWAAGLHISSLTLPPAKDRQNHKIMMHGNEAIAMGAMAAGVKFCSFYPMSPATTVPLTLATSAARMGIVVEQVEDEIAAINMAVGASFAGARALAATSGGGFALMAEGLSLAGICETPVVLVIAMRPGPATGLATRTEQADLNAALYFGHGEFPRAVYAPGSLQECFDLAVEAFSQTEIYQTPTIILTDQYLADSYRDTAPFALDKAPALFMQTPPDDPTYKRYAFTESGVSPLRFPGAGKTLVVVDSHEHTEDGHVTEHLPTRVKMQDKRMKKLEGMRKDALPPTFTGPASPDLLLVCWGSASGAVCEAAEVLRGQGKSVGTCHFSQVFPLREEAFLPRFKAAKEVVMVESNSTGQMAALIRQETGFTFHGKVLRYDGLPLTAPYILNRLAKA